MKKIHITSPIINGEISHKGKFTFIKSPYNNKSVAKLFYATKKEINEAFNTRPLLDMNKYEKMNIFNKLSKKLKSNKNKLARITTIENGSPISFTEKQVEESVYFINNFHKLEIELEDKYILEPKGTVLLGIPFNEPILVTMNSLIPAIFFGNKVVVKPSESAPSASFEIVKYLINVGWPQNTIQYLPIQRENVETIISNPNLDVVFWTGGSKSVKVVGSLALKYGKEFIPESEGNDWAIIDDDCNIEEVSKIIFKGFTTNNGEMCNAIRGVFVKESIYTEIIEILKEQIDKIKMGNPLKKSVDIGPLKNKEIVKNLVERVVETKSENYGMEYYDNFFHPTIVIDPPLDSRIVREESFGPLLWVKPIKNLKMAAEYYNIYNKHKLCIAIFSKRKYLINYLKSRIRCTIIHINRNPLEVSPLFPWGGRGLSGFGGAKSWANKFLDNKYVLE
ncbi:MAG: aldehyde dehydrogenase family protein [Candidatus Omnitrophica bacterium]|nr:aldehyde dehydrogenase family protein [Candidatus Omnitrophota bacterium]